MKQYENVLCINIKIHFVIYFRHIALPRFTLTSMRVMEKCSSVFVLEQATAPYEHV